MYMYACTYTYVHCIYMCMHLSASICLTVCSLKWSMLFVSINLSIDNNVFLHFLYMKLLDVQTCGYLGSKKEKRKSNQTISTLSFAQSFTVY